MRPRRALSAPPTRSFIRTITSLCLMACSVLPAAGQKGGQALVDSLEQRLTITPEDTNRVKLLLRIALELSLLHPDKSLRNGNEALTLAKRLGWRTGEAMALERIGRVNWSNGAYGQAKVIHEQALAIRKELGDHSRVASTLALLGQDHADAGEYGEALTRFGEALEINQRLGKPSDIAYVHNLMAWVYGQMGMYAETAAHQYASLRLAEKAGDRYAVAVELSNIATTKMQQEHYAEAIADFEKASTVFEDIDDPFNLAVNRLEIGSCLVALGQEEQAIVQFDLALAIGERTGDPEITGRVFLEMARMYVHHGKDRDALEQLRRAEVAYTDANNRVDLGRVYTSLGECQTRLGELQAARVSFEKARTIAEEVKSLADRSASHQGLMRLDSAAGHWRGAFEHLKSHVSLRDSMYNEENTRRIERSRAQYEFDKKEAAAKAEQEKKDQRQRLVRNGIGAGLAGALVFLLVVWRQRNKISKARKRSDELLLNILPEEVADELKLKGEAEAKQFDNVTILFTDFKGFTHASETMGPQELVAELNTCFKAFDNIITARGIEKIKTIGDAYMCAGGLPDPKSSSPADVVHAGLEMQAFMKQRKAERDAQGRPVFEMRVGIHTGPAVAGIVGVKKFQYDIWGDTVNTASRMESSGEVGQVNISEATYQLLVVSSQLSGDSGLTTDNHQLTTPAFTFTPRGKVQAKGKGEMEMFFVQRSGENA